MKMNKNKNMRRMSEVSFLDFDVEKAIINKHTCYENYELFGIISRSQARLHALILMDMINVLHDDYFFEKTELDLIHSLLFIIRSAGIRKNTMEEMILKETKYDVL